jgi:hypothetical protein
MPTGGGEGLRGIPDVGLTRAAFQALINTYDMMSFEAADAAALEGVNSSFRERLTDRGLRPEEVESALASIRKSIGAAEPTKPTIKVRVIGTCPAETVCLHCHQTGDVKRIANAAVVGGKSETLHEGCAAEWFAKL